MVVYSTVKLNTGALMPVLGFGTWRASPGEVGKAVEIALKTGYRHIDTATGYSNEKEVGDGIKASGVPREDIFLTTKLSTFDMKPSNVKAAFDYSFKELGTYIDLWLVHWPAPMVQLESGSAPDKSTDWLDTWHAVEKVYLENKDKVRAIGVSNWAIPNLERLLKNSTIVPAVNQIELHPACPQTDLVNFCRARGIALMGFAPLAFSDSKGSHLLSNPIVTKIAERKGVSPANVLISLWANQEQITILTKSVTPERILSNTKIIELSSEEIDELLAINKTIQFRLCHPGWTGWGGLGFPDCE